jgi:tripartite-type tricarboxylate transporter receptor subunit TctC
MSSFSSTRRTMLAALACTALPLISRAAISWPSRPVTIVVPFPPGGQTDMIGRMLAQRLTQHFGQTFIVDNKPGANGSLGSDLVARAPADGNTLVITGAGSHAINQLVNRNVRYDSRSDFTHIAMLLRTGAVLLAGPSFKGNSLKDVLTQAKANPDKLNIAITGLGSTGHLSVEILKRAAGIEINSVPYKGDSPAISDVLGGQVDLIFVAVTPAVPFVQAGKLRPIAVTTPSRIEVLPNVPTFTELGLPAITVQSWNGLAGPKGMPADVVERLNKVCEEFLAQPDVQERFRAQGIVGMPGSARDAQAFVAAEIDKLSKIVKAANIRVE